MELESLVSVAKSKNAPRTSDADTLPYGGGVDRGTNTPPAALSRLPVLRSLIEAKGCGLLGHSARVSGIACAVGAKIGLPRTELELLATAAEVHDIGKLGVPDRILLKSGRLTDAEYAVIQQHPEVGRDLLRMAGSRGNLLDVVLCHHERWDGEGYPFRRRTTESPLAARILSLADTVDAMASDRPYRASQPMERIFGELERCSGTQFDPNLVDVFLTLARGSRSHDWVDRIAAQGAGQLAA